MIAGTITRNRDLTVKKFGGTLYSISSKEITRPVVKMEPISISNGLCWSYAKDKEELFHIDSERKKVSAFRFDVEKGRISKNI